MFYSLIAVFFAFLTLSMPAFAKAPVDAAVDEQAGNSHYELYLNCVDDKMSDNAWLSLKEADGECGHHLAGTRRVIRQANQDTEISALQSLSIYERYLECMNDLLKKHYYEDVADRHCGREL